MAICKDCGGFIQWIKIKGRLNGQNADGSDHWDLCSKLKAERIMRTGEKFTVKRGNDRVTGYATPFKSSGEMLTKIDAVKAIRGEHFNPNSGCKQCVPPWEVCPNCPAAIA